MDTFEAILDQQNLCMEAYKAGKIKIANDLAETILQYLLEYKRIAAIKVFIKQIETLGFPLKKIKKYELEVSELVGERTGSLKNLEWHIEHFKTSQEVLRTFILEQEEWTKKEITLCYEYILRFGYDQEIFKYLDEIKNKSKIDKIDQTEEEVLKNPLKLNYEQIAYDIISGKKSAEELEQSKIIAYFKLHNFNENKEQLKEMVMAFYFLGMNDVVTFLCEKILPSFEDTKERASLAYILIESMLNKNEYLKALQYTENFLGIEPLIGEEKIALEYLRAETCYLLERKQEALKHFKILAKKSPHYRLVNQRLRALESN